MSHFLSLSKIYFENQEIVVPQLDQYSLSQDLFLSEQQFVSYLDILIDQIVKNENKKNKKFSICLNNNTFERQRIQMNIPTILDNFIHVDLSTFTIKISQNSLDYILSACTNTPLIILPIKLTILNTQSEYLSNENFSTIPEISYSLIDDILLSDFDSTSTHLYHSNVVIIDNINKTIEYYEPHGIMLNHVSTTLINLPNLIKNTLYNYLPFTQNYMIINASTTCIIGPQTKQQQVEPSAGHCLAWSLYFITLRILNHHLNPIIENTSEFLNRFLTSTFTPIILDIMIKQFISFVNLLPPTITTYSNNLHINIENHITNYELYNIGNRITYLSKMFFQKQSNSSIKNMDKLFEELISYRKYPEFHVLLNNAYKQVLIDNMLNI